MSRSIPIALLLILSVAESCRSPLCEKGALCYDCRLTNPDKLKQIHQKTARRRPTLNRDVVANPMQYQYKCNIEGCAFGTNGTGTEEGLAKHYEKHPEHKTGSWLCKTC